MDALGDAIVVWPGDNAGRFRIVARRYVPGQGWGTTQPIDGDDADDAYDPSIAMDACGRAVVAWRQEVRMKNRIVANRFVPGDGWGTARRIIRFWAEGGSPDVAMDPAGNAIVVWQQANFETFDIWANRFVPGQGWGWAELVEANGVAKTHTPRVGMDPAGNAVAVWTADYIGSTSIQGKVLQ